MSTDHDDRRYGALGTSSGMRAWGDAHPAAMAAIQGLLFGILFGVILALTSSHASPGAQMARAAVSGLLFGLAMWAVHTYRRRTGGAAD